MLDCDLQPLWPVVCQLVHAFYIIFAFLCVILAAVVVALGFTADVCTWFSLKLYEWYIPFFMKVFELLSAAFSYNC